MSLESVLKKSISGVAAGIALACAPMSCGPDDPDTPDGNTADIGNYDSGNPDAGPDANYDAGTPDSGTDNNDSGPYDAGVDAGDDAGPDAGTNISPIAHAGPDMTIQKNKGYCFNFSNNDKNLTTWCGSAPLAPGHSTNGTGSYDSDGNIMKYTVWHSKDILPDVWLNAQDGKIILDYPVAEIARLVLCVKDNNNTETCDEAIITITD